MSKEKELASSLIEKTLEYQGEAFVEIGGYPVTHPYQWIETLTYYQQTQLYLSSAEFDSLSVANHLFDPKNIPQEWVAFIKEAGELRKENGCEGPLDFITAVRHLIEEDPLARQLNLPNFDFLPQGDVDLRDEAKVKRIINSVLSHPELREKLLRMASCLIPDRSIVPLDHEEVIEFLENQGIKSGVILDLGCGTGEQTPDWQEETGLITIGVDRQYHPRYYNPHWHSQNPRLAFVRCDFMRGLPFPDNSINVAVMANVTAHVNQEGLERALSEAERVLANRGILLVGPQISENPTSWRVFQKERLGKSATLLEVNPQ